MNKKTAVIIGAIVILATLFVNVIFSEDLENTDLTFSNVDALAEEESSRIPQCVESGTICIGYDKNDLWSKHPGLQLNPEL